MHDSRKHVAAVAAADDDHTCTAVARSSFQLKRRLLTSLAAFTAHKTIVTVLAIR